MHNMPVLSLLVDYTVFQLVTWQLYRKKVFDTRAFAELANKINQGFFGKPEDGAPLGAKLQLRHLRRRHADLWKVHNVAGFCLASMLVCRSLQLSGKKLEEWSPANRVAAVAKPIKSQKAVTAWWNSRLKR